MGYLILVTVFFSSDVCFQQIEIKGCPTYCNASEGRDPIDVLYVETNSSVKPVLAIPIP
jgi:hypothetical protein